MSEITTFLDVLNKHNNQTITVETTSVKKLEVLPLSFKQQKSLISNGLDGIIGAIQFIKNLNTVILTNSDNADLKVFDRVPIALALRQELSDKTITIDDVEVTIDELVENFVPYTGVKELLLKQEDYEILLESPTLEIENHYLSLCLNDLRSRNDDNLGKNVSVILSHEIPKFIKSFKFNDTELLMSSLGLSDRVKILDTLSAKVTNEITDFILKFREYEEKLLTVKGVTIDLDANFFE